MRKFFIMGLAALLAACAPIPGTSVVTRVDTTHVPLIVFDTIHTPVTKFDTSHVAVVIPDTTHPKVVIPDTTRPKVVIPDTSRVPFVITDTSHVPFIKYDTAHKPVVIFDTTHTPVVIFDTTHTAVVIYDTTHTTTPPPPVDTATSTAPAPTGAILADLRSAIQTSPDFASAMTKSGASYEVMNGLPFTMDVNAAGTGVHGLRVDWTAWNGVTAADEGATLLINLPTLPRHVMFSWKHRMYAPFQITNLAASSNASRKMWLVCRVNADNGCTGRIDYIWPGPAPVSPRVDYSAANLNFGVQSGVSFNPQDHVGETLNTTLELQAASSATASDGIVRLWINGKLLISNTHAQIGSAAFNRFQFPATFNSPTHAQSEAFWDVVAWAPDGNVTPPPPVDTVVTPPSLTLASISPATITPGQTVTLVFTGSGFTSASSVHASGSDANVGGGVVNAAGTQLSLTLLVPPFPAGPFEVYVQNANGSKSASRTLTVTGAATVVDTTTPPPQNGGAGVSSLDLISDDFSSYAGTAALQAKISTNIGGTGSPASALYGDGHFPELAEIDKTVLYNGHATLKMNQPTGVSNTPQLAVRLPHSSTHIWYRAKIRFSAGWTTKGTTAAANAYKVLSWGWDGSGFDGSGRIEITNTTQYEAYEGVQKGGTLVSSENYVVGPNVTTEWSDGGWYDYIIEVDHTTANGVVRFWKSKDGQTPVYVGQEISKMNDGTIMPALTGITVGLNFNQIRTQAQTLWWGQWEVVDGNAHANPFGI